MGKGDIRTRRGKIYRAHSQDTAEEEKISAEEILRERSSIASHTDQWGQAGISCRNIPAGSAQALADDRG